MFKNPSTFYETDFCYTVEWESGKIDFWIEHNTDSNWCFFYSPKYTLPEEYTTDLSAYFAKQMTKL